MTRKRTPRMEERAVQPDPNDIARAQHADRVAELEAEVTALRARPGTPAEWSALMEAACGERDRLRLRLERELATTTRLTSALRQIAASDTDPGAVRSLAAEALGREVT